MRKFIYLLFLISVVYACKSLKSTVADGYQSVTVSTFLEQPFGENETVASLKTRFGKDVKIKRMVRRNKHDTQKVDTIFQFYHRKSSVFVYKTYFNREMILGGVIYDNRFPFVNGVAPGMNREQFFRSFKDLPLSPADSINLNSKEEARKFTFVFDSKGVLKKISFTMYVD